MKLYQFGQKKELITYITGNSARLTQSKFDPFGVRFGATDTRGELHLWKFDSSLSGQHPSQTIQCNSAITNDFTFLNSGTLLATAGVSSNGR